MRRALLVSGLMAMVMISACGGGGDPQASPSPTATASPTGAVTAAASGKQAVDQAVHRAAVASGKFRALKRSDTPAVLRDTMATVATDLDDAAALLTPTPAGLPELKAGLARDAYRNAAADLRTFLSCSKSLTTETSQACDEQEAHAFAAISLVVTQTAQQLLPYSTVTQDEFYRVSSP